MITTERLDGFVGFMIERENIRIKKEAGEPWPWTEDPILQQFKFTNVHRYDDRTSRELNEIYKKHEPNSVAAVILYNCALYRYFGTIEFAREIGWRTLHSSREIAMVASTMLRAGKKVFTSAYVVTNGGRSEPKENVVAEYIEQVWWRAPEIIAELARTQRWEVAYDMLRKLPGFGGSGFMAKEVLQDLLMALPKTPIEDRDTFTPMGPGGRRGMNRMHARDLRFTQPEKKFVEECRLLRAAVLPRWPEDWAYLTAHDIQFQLCEFDKYMRAKLGEGQPKNRYVRSR